LGGDYSLAMLHRTRQGEVEHHRDIIALGQRARVASIRLHPAAAPCVHRGEVWICHRHVVPSVSRQPATHSLSVDDSITNGREAEREGRSALLKNLMATLIEAARKQF
jgi:hypothetical protein